MGIRCKDGVVLVISDRLSYCFKPLEQLNASSSKALPEARCPMCKAAGKQGVEKTIISKMLEKGSNRRTFPVDEHAGVVRLQMLVRRCRIAHTLQLMVLTQHAPVVSRRSPGSSQTAGRSSIGPTMRLCSTRSACASPPSDHTANNACAPATAWY